MQTLYKAILSQHSRSITPLKFVEQMTAQLQNFFEDIVLENDLSALVITSLPLRKQRSRREVERLLKVARAARHSYFLISPEDELGRYINSPELTGEIAEGKNPPIFLPYQHESNKGENFIIISDPHFSGLLVSLPLDDEKSDGTEIAEVLWTFDPDIVFTALQTLLGRFIVEYPSVSDGFRGAMEQCIPKTISLIMTLAVTTRLAQIWQKQTNLQLAINKIASATRQSLDLRQALQTAADEVARALNIETCIFHLEPERRSEQIDVSHSEQIAGSEYETIASDLNAYTRRLQNNPQPHIRDGALCEINCNSDLPTVVMPIVFWEKTIGILFVQTQDLTRIWQHDEIALLQTVADQVAIAANHARLYIQSQQEALTDSLTGVFNRRFMEIQLEREIRNARRLQQPFALLVIDIDNFKRVNDTHGHAVGDNVIHQVAQIVGQTTGALDTVARYGGEEFVVILPQTGIEEAKIIAEKIRLEVSTEIFPDVGSITVSLGAAAFPRHAETSTELFVAADKCLLQAKRSGRNCVVSPTDTKLENPFGANENLPLVVTSENFGRAGAFDEKPNEVFSNG